MEIIVWIWYRDNKNIEIMLNYLILMNIIWKGEWFKRVVCKMNIIEERDILVW